MDTLTHDYLIIGQGLAGSVLAHQLKSAGKSVMMLDNDHHVSSSMVAAGIINPVTGHRLNITEGFERFYPNAQQYYTFLEQELGVEVWQTIEQLRLVKNAGQFDYFQKRRGEPDYKNLISTLAHSAYFPNAEFGATHINKTVVVDTTTLLRTIKEWLINHHSYLSSKVDYAEFTFTNSGVSYQHVNASKVVFCEGFQAINNPWLRHLPFKLSKGEVLSVELTSQPNELLNWGNWLLPNLNRKSGKLGSSYEWNNTNLEPTLEIKNKLLAGLKKHTGLSAKVIHHKAGIRPTTTQRKPFIGALSKLKHAYCFNGFGSKGCLLIPYYAQLLVKHLVNDTDLPEELTQCL